MTPMRPTVLVTGGAGFIGSHVADAYISAGFEVTVLDNLSSGRRENVPVGAQFVEADVQSIEARDLIEGGGFTVLNHHAAQTDVSCSVADPLADASVNILGLLNLLQGAQTGNLKRVIFPSSASVYGLAARLPIHEGAAKVPASPYGAAKLASEYYLRVFAQLYAIEAVTLRYSNVYGPRQHPQGEGGVVAVFARRLLAGEPLTVYGDGHQTRDMVHVSDVAAANIIATRCDLPRLDDIDTCAYNISTGIETSVNRLADLMSERVAHPCIVRHAPERRGEVRGSALFPGKAKSELGWAPQTALPDGLRSALCRLESAKIGSDTLPT